MELKPKKTLYTKIFFWWNLIWWSLPYSKPIGRQMRFLLWDRYHNAPFGLLGLQSPPLRSKVRDQYLGLQSHNNAYWINQSLYGQRIGALPPYNDLIGSKMVALSLVSNQVRDAYRQKYSNKISLLKKEKLPANLLFLTTTSAFGKSSVYSRLKFKGKEVSEFIGFTTGQGTFHISEKLYEEIISFLENNGVNVERGYGTGPSRKLYLIQKGFSMLGIPQYLFHNIKRGYYIFLNVNNIKEIIHNNARPDWIDRDFYELEKFWKKRWCLPRSKRTDKWRHYDHEHFMEKVQKRLNQMEH